MALLDEAAFLGRQMKNFLAMFCFSQTGSMVSKDYFQLALSAMLVGGIVASSGFPLLVKIILLPVVALDVLRSFAQMFLAMSEDCVDDQE